MADLVDTRLRDARPPAADVDLDAFDPVLLAQVRRQSPQRPPRRAGRLALPAAGLVATGVAAILFVVPGGPSATPTAAAAVRQAQQWFDPPAGTILHVRSELVSFAPGGGSDTIVQETWQSVDDPNRQRYLQNQDGRAVESETGRGAFYDVGRDTLYERVTDESSEPEIRRRAFARKLAAAEEAGASDADLDRMRAQMNEYLRGGSEQEAVGGPMALGDPTVAQVRMLLDKGEVELGAAKTHAGVRALPIFIRRGEPRWTLWTAAEDGRPLELRVDSGPGTEPLQITRWTDYEVLPFDGALISLDAAHPGADIIRSDAAYREAVRRLFPQG